MKTSKDSPLEIDFVYAPDSAGRIGMTFCPGKKQRGAMTGDWCRDLALDFEVIQAWGATVIVNLIEDHEMVALNVQDTVQHVPAGIQYVRLPIPDFGVLLGRLRRGESILLHCKGGLGRTGMIAARILAELGRSPDDAIKAVRQARAGAIETGEQEAYVRALKHG